MTTHPHRSAALPTLLASLALGMLTPSVALADAAPANVAAADALFQSAQQDLEQGKWADGCPKFERSMTLDPSVSTLLNIAKCHDHDGKLILAWNALQRAIVMNRDTPDGDRQAALDKYSRDALAVLEERLPYLTIRVTDDVPGLSVRRDDALVDLKTLGQPIPVDPGKHVVVARAPGFKSQRTEIALAERKREQVLISLTKAPVSTTSPSEPYVQPAEPPADTSGSRSIPVWVWPVGGAGVALVATSVYFTTAWASNTNDLDDRVKVLCQPTCPRSSQSELQPLVDAANTSAGLAVGLGAAGVGAVGAAVVGILIAKPKASTNATAWTLAPWAAPGSGGLGASGTF